MRKTVPKNPRIVLLADGKVGLETARYLKKQKENIVALIIHPRKTPKLTDPILKAKLSDEVRRTAQAKNVFYGNKLRDSVYLSKIKKLNPDLAISARFSCILKREFIDRRL